MIQPVTLGPGSYDVTSGNIGHLSGSEACSTSAWKRSAVRHLPIPYLRDKKFWNKVMYQLKTKIITPW